MLPLQRYVAGQALFKNTSIYDAEIGKDYVPKNAEDLKKVYLQLNHPQSRSLRDGLVSEPAFSINFYSAMHGAPNNWRLESGGKLTKNFETPSSKKPSATCAICSPRGFSTPARSTTRTSTPRGSTSWPAALRCTRKGSASPGRTSGGGDYATIRRTTSSRCHPSPRTTAASRNTSWARASLPPTPSRKPAPTASRNSCGSWTSWPHRSVRRKTCCSSTAWRMSTTRSTRAAS